MGKNVFYIALTSLALLSAIFIYTEVKINAIESVTNDSLLPGDSATVVKKTEDTLQEKTAVSPNKSSLTAQCIESERYLAVTVDMGVKQYPELYLYQKATLGEEIECRKYETTPLFSMNLEATRVLFIFGDFLITDTGTGPNGRVLSVYNIESGEKIVSDVYGHGGVATSSAQMISYWRPVKVAATDENCPEIQDIEKSYLVPEVHEYINRDLGTGGITTAGWRCVGVQ